MKAFGSGHSLIVFLTLIHQVTTSWWLQSLSSQVISIGSMGSCNNIAGLVKEQKVLCRKYPSLMRVVANGAHLGLSECQHQFSTSKWNCSHVDPRQKGLLGLLTSQANREAAFFQAITSAGVVVKVTQACNSDKYHRACTCDYKNAGRKGKDFQWNSCNDNVKFGMTFTQKFLDAREIGNDARVLMNKQNNLAGRLAVKENVKLECTCHGVSGSCNVKTCRYTLSEFYRVGDHLHNAYESAVAAVLDQTQNSLVPKISAEKIRKRNLVFLELSPDYCVKDLKEGTLGVAGRRCNKTSPGTDGCEIMCCGMGFHTKKVWVESNCNCSFIWCCKVKCQTCRQEVKQHFCRSKKRRRKFRNQQNDEPREKNLVNSITEEGKLIQRDQPQKLNVDLIDDNYKKT
ncbi:protein Wnt-2b-A-like [Hydractinia symbiolongicarpus]|nr:protein Wnt-2b-A-like [Hydractinia symbiolongicarpus]